MRFMICIVETILWIIFFILCILYHFNWLDVGVWFFIAGGMLMIMGCCADWYVFGDAWRD